MTDPPSGASAAPSAGPVAAISMAQSTALPSVRARVIAFATILGAGALGGAVGYWFMLLQCTGACTVPSGLGMLVGTLVGSIGAAIVTTFALRMLPEWTSSGR